ncbi:Uncharacterised protein [Mycobacteroides abscessus]|nr:Uncharacterised protein [Mycobacteroides abscessus]
MTATSSRCPGPGGCANSYGTPSASPAACASSTPDARSSRPWSSGSRAAGRGTGVVVTS